MLNLFSGLHQLREGNIVQYYKIQQPTVQNKLSEKEGELDYKISEKNTFDTFLQKVLPTIIDYKKNIIIHIESRSCTGAKPSELLSNIKKINREIEFLKALKKQPINEDNNKILYAAEMSKGFIGLYCDKILSMGNEERGEYINHLLETCMKYAYHVRSYYIMHNVVDTDQEPINYLYDEWISPLSCDFEILQNVLDKTITDSISLAEALMRLGKYQQALELLEKQLELIENGGSINRFASDDLLEKLKNNDYPNKEQINIFNSLLPNSMERQFNNAQYYWDKLVLIDNMIECCLLSQNLEKGIKLVEEGIAVYDFIKQKFRCAKLGQKLFSQFIPNNSIQTEVDIFLNKLWITFNLHKSYILYNLGKYEESNKLLDSVNQFFDDQQVINLDEYGSLLAKLYTFFAMDRNLTEKDKNNYLEKIQEIKSSCLDGLVVEFNILFQKYESELAKGLDNFDKKKVAVEALFDNFSVNEAKFKRELGLDYYRYKIEVNLAKINTLFDNIPQAAEILDGLQEFYDNTNNIVTKNKYLISVIQFACVQNNFERFKYGVDEFLSNNIGAGTQYKVAQYLLPQIYEMFVPSKLNYCEYLGEKILKYIELSFDEITKLTTLLKISYLGKEIKNYQKYAELNELLIKKYNISDITNPFCALTVSGLCGSYKELAEQGQEKDIRDDNLCKLYYTKLYFDLNKEEDLTNMVNTMPFLEFRFAAMSYLVRIFDPAKFVRVLSKDVENLYYNLEDYNSAIKNWNLLIELVNSIEEIADNNLLPLIFNVARSYHKNFEYEQAKEMYNKVLEINSTHQKSIAALNEITLAGSSDYVDQ